MTRGPRRARFEHLRDQALGSAQTKIWLKVSLRMTSRGASLSAGMPPADRQAAMATASLSRLYCRLAWPRVAGPGTERPCQPLHRLLRPTTPPSCPSQVHPDVGLRCPLQLAAQDLSRRCIALLLPYLSPPGAAQRAPSPPHRPRRCRATERSLGLGAAQAIPVQSNLLSRWRGECCRG